jgi:peptide methionine sulfoxide reductase MsrB
MSLAELPRHKKYPKYEDLCRRFEDFSSHKGSWLTPKAYHAVSCKPITIVAEDDMELLSSICGNERYLHNYAEGHYKCSRCETILYDSRDKFKGPCSWASFRSSCEDAVSFVNCEDYNGYTVQVDEAYCGNCDLFIGHRFFDGIAKGDTSVHATNWRH